MKSVRQQAMRALPRSARRALVGWAIRAAYKISPEAGAKASYLLVMRRRLNLKSPRSFNEKIQWLKLYLYASDPLVVQCSDKLAVRQYVESVGLGDTLNGVLGVYPGVALIPWEDLPDQFVLKTTHGCGGNVICRRRSELDRAAATELLDNSLETDYGSISGEMHYSLITPKILAEPYLRDGDRDLPRDYKVYCFNGVPRAVLVISGRGTRIKLDLMDLEWARLPWTRPQFWSETPPERPAQLDEFVAHASRLSAPFPFVRVDFFLINDATIFGEMTFTPASGLATYYTAEGDAVLGGLLTLPL